MILGPGFPIVWKGVVNDENHDVRMGVLPPHISGGLGTACYGMIRALTGMGHDILFVMPGPEVTETDSPVRVLSTTAIPLNEGPREESPAGRIDFEPIVSPLRPYINGLSPGNSCGPQGAYLPESFLVVSG